MVLLWFLFISYKSFALQISDEVMDISEWVVEFLSTTSKVILFTRHDMERRKIKQSGGLKIFLLGEGVIAVPERGQRWPPMS